MSGDRNSPPPAPAAASRRRSSFAGLADLFGARSPPAASAAPTTTAYPGPITSAAAEASRRRLSVSTLGLSGSPTQSTPFGSLRSRTGSISSANSASVDESPFEENDAAAGPATAPTTPFARRLSFGARALRDVRTGTTGNGNPNGRASVDKAAFSSPTAKGRGEGFNFAENLRTRAERSSVSNPPSAGTSPTTAMHQRAKSVAVMEPPAKEMPKAARVPDAFQERILKGDFYMD